MPSCCSSSRPSFRSRAWYIRKSRTAMADCLNGIGTPSWVQLSFVSSHSPHLYPWRWGIGRRELRLPILPAESGCRCRSRRAILEMSDLRECDSRPYATSQTCRWKRPEEMPLLLRAHQDRRHQVQALRPDVRWKSIIPTASTAGTDVSAAPTREEVRSASDYAHERNSRGV